MKFIHSHNIFFIIIFSVTILFAIGVLHSQSVLEPEAHIEPIPDDVDLTLKNIQYTKSRNGELFWTLLAESAEQGAEDGIVRLKNVRLSFLAAGYDDIELTADHGELLPENQTVTVRSNVTMIYQGKNTLQTDFLKYAETTNMLETDRKVKISTDNSIVCGRGMSVDIVERTLTLLHSVQAEIDGVDGQFDCLK